MPSHNAALGLGQLERLPSLLQAKEALARRYQDAFAGVAGAFFFQPASHTRSNHWLNTLILDCDDAQALEAILALLNREGIHARPAWTPMHALPMYQRCPRMPLPETERLARTVVNLPSGPGLIETPAA
jgi:perosamine synthetase